MLDESPHIMQTLLREPPAVDEYGRQVSAASAQWQDPVPCFCHDNSQAQQVSVNGRLWTYDFHVVYEGEPVPPGTEVRCLDAGGNVVGTGIVRRMARCFTRELAGRCDLWLEQSTR